MKSSDAIHQILSCITRKGDDPMNVQLVVFIVYLIFMLGIGVFFFLRTRNGNEKD